MIAIPVIVASVTGAAVYFIAGLFKSPPPFAQAPFVPAPPAPAPSAPVKDPNDLGGLNPGVLPLDADGFPQQATMQFLQDNNLQERVFGPIVEQTPETFTPVSRTTTTSAAVPSAPVQDVFRDPGTGLSNQNGPEPIEEEEEESFLDSLNPFS